jgi:CheY-like chemotaxis protein
VVGTVLAHQQVLRTAHQRPLPQPLLDAFDEKARVALVDSLTRLGRRDEAQEHLEAGLRPLRDAGSPAGGLASAAHRLRVAKTPEHTAMPQATNNAGAASLTPPPADSGAGSGRLVIVDNEAELGRMVAEYLRRHGFAVRTATSHRELDILLKAGPADLVLLDVDMAGQDGFTIARRMNARGGPPVLFLTANDDVVDHVAGLELGALDYITKPFDLREMGARPRSPAADGRDPVLTPETGPSGAQVFQAQ